MPNVQKMQANDYVVSLVQPSIEFSFFYHSTKTRRNMFNAMAKRVVFDQEKTKIITLGVKRLGVSPIHLTRPLWLPECNVGTTLWNAGLSLQMLLYGMDKFFIIDES